MSTSFTIEEELRSKILESSGLYLADLRNTKQSRDRYTNLIPGGLGRLRRFEKFAMHGKPAKFQNAPRYNTILMKGALSSDGPWSAYAFQIIGCSWRCWYCYVDGKLLKGNRRAGKLTSYAAMAREVSTATLQADLVDLTGGQPDLIPEWPLRMRDALFNEGRGDFPIRSEDNLSNYFLWRFLSEQDRRRLADDPFYTRVGCFKGFDGESFGAATRSEPAGFLVQLDIAKRLFLEGFEPFYYATFAPKNPDNIFARVSGFFDTLRRIHDALPLRLFPLRLRSVDTWSARSYRERRVDLEEESIEAWFTLLERAYGTVPFLGEPAEDGF